MKTRPIYRAIVIGCPGSGKSTFARALHGLTGLPLYYLDMLRWDSSGSMIPTDVFHSRLAVAMQKDNWIIDGNCISTLEKRARQADTVFFLDYPLEVCLGGIRSRKGQPRPGMPFVPDDEADVEFMEYVRSFRDERRPQIPGTLSRHPEKQTLVFADRQEADTFLNSLSRRANRLIPCAPRDFSYELARLDAAARRNEARKAMFALSPLHMQGIAMRYFQAVNGVFLSRMLSCSRDDGGGGSKSRKRICLFAAVLRCVVREIPQKSS